MPSSPSQKFYWDANVFLAYISGEQQRLPDLEALLDEAEHGDTAIYTSELSVVEVAFAASEASSAGLDPVVENKIDALWVHPSPIHRVDFHALIARDARHLMRISLATPGQRVKPADAIHLATAQRLGVDVLHTYEDQAARNRWAQLTGLPVEEPRATQPKLTPQNPSAQPPLS